MKTNKSKARFTGLMYLIIIIMGLFSGMVAREAMIVPQDAQQTAENILNSESLFRMGVVTDLIMTMADIVVALMLYVLLKPVNRNLSLLAAFFRLAQASVIGMNMLNHIMAIAVLKGGGSYDSFGADQLNALSMLFLDAHSYGYLLSNVFFGFSCGILAYLFYRSELFPKFLGYMIGLASFGYLVNCFIKFVMPEYGEMSEVLLLLTAVVTELTLCLYLLIKGTKTAE